MWHWVEVVCTTIYLLNRCLVAHCHSTWLLCWKHIQSITFSAWKSFFYADIPNDPYLCSLRGWCDTLVEMESVISSMKVEYINHVNWRLTLGFTFYLEVIATILWKSKFLSNVEEEDRGTPLFVCEVFWCHWILIDFNIRINCPIWTKYWKPYVSCVNDAHGSTLLLYWRVDCGGFGLQPM